MIRVATTSNQGFIFNGFSLQLVYGQKQSLELGGTAELTTDGLFRLTSNTAFHIGHVFYSVPFKFKSSSNTNAFSFSTTFTFAIVRENSRGHGITFVLSPSKELAQEFKDIDDYHVGIDVNSLTSVRYASAGYVNSRTGKFQPTDLSCGERIQVWVEYDGTKHQLNVTLSPVIRMSKPKAPLLSMDIDLSPIILEQMYFGFSSATGLQVASTYISGWSFQMDGVAEDLDLTKLPSVPSTGKKKSRRKAIILAVALSISGVVLLTVIFSAIFFLARKKPRFTEILEDWEVQFGPHTFPYRDLFIATRGFNEKELLGQGGFGQVFRGELPAAKVQIAVKRIFHKSEERMKEFIAEIGTIGRQRHPNLVRLLGYCRGKDELLLVYDYMPNGSLDKFLYNKPEETTHVAGTFGYIAPELAKTGRASTSTDVYAFGAFCLEVACGRRPVMPRASAEWVHLVDLVFKYWNEGDILRTADPQLGKDFEVEEIELVLKLGLFCTHNVASFRPNMPQVISYLNGQSSLPENLDTILHTQELLEKSHGHSLTCTKDSVATMAITESFQSAGR
ncbi:hypothetical protein DITRI_Ditri06bG0077700 [Diplodiscus trichospermus]